MLTSFKPGKMLPISPRRDFIQIDVLGFQLQEGKRCPFFSVFFHPDQSLRFAGSKQKEMLPIFVQDFFIQMDILLFRVQNKGKCCRFFSNFFTSMLLFDRVQNRGECCPFSPEGECCPLFSTIFFGLQLQNKGKCCPFFSNNCSSKSTCFGFKARGNAALFSPRGLHPNKLCMLFTIG